MLNFKLDLAESYKNLKTGEGGDKKDKNWRRVQKELNKTCLQILNVHQSHKLLEGQGQKHFVFKKTDRNRSFRFYLKRKFTVMYS